MKLLCGEQRESRPGGTQIETGLRAENRSGARASAIGARLAFLKHEPEQIMVLTHARNYRSEDIRQSKKRWKVTCVSSTPDQTRRSARFMFGSQATRLPLQTRTPQPTPRRIGSDAAYSAGRIEPKCLYPLLEIWQDAKLIC